LTKYCNESEDGFNGFTDNLTELLPEDDAATVNWGPNWRMPNNDQINELRNNTTSEWTTINGVKGRKITSNSNGNSIFLPAAGYFYGTGLDHVGDYGFYWSRSFSTGLPYDAHQMVINDSYLYTNAPMRYEGKTIRPVYVKDKPEEHEYVDLGLPSGTLWATCNVGANSPEEFGDKFAWGETMPKGGYTWESYKYCEESPNTLTKYCNDSKYGYNGFTDSLTDLLPEDDAATVNWGSEWQTPSFDQIEELINSEYTTTEWTQVNGVNGWKITSKSNENSIFLPASSYDYSNYGSYWSRTFIFDLPYDAETLVIREDGIGCSGYMRDMGNTVRPVRYKEPVWVSSIVLSETSLNMEVGTFRLLTSTFEPANAENSRMFWKSSDKNVATMYGDKVQAHSVGTCTITCYAMDGSGVKAECQVTVYEPEEHDFVDLGLPSGTLWATCNVGAETPEDYGDYFRWGETITKDIYDNNIPECHVKELDAAHDAATVNWGSCWQMPSIEQIGELINSVYTTTVWTTVNGVNGRKITSNINGNSIFLPAAGWYYYDSVENGGSKGGYWSRSHGNPSGYIACLSFNSNDINDTSLIFYSMGQTVRPVRKKEVYAELAEETGTMTYYYDYDRASRSGLTKLYDPVTRYAFPSSIFNKKVLKAVIDPSMKEAKMTSMSDMFSYCSQITSIEGLENLNTDNVTDMSLMFLFCTKLKSLDLSSFNTSNVTRMDYMFEGCSSLQIIDLTSFDITNVTLMACMFDSCDELTTICCFGDWSTSNANSNFMFWGCDKLVGGKGTPYNDAFVDKTYARPDGGTGSPGYFTADTMTGIKAIDNGQRTTDGSIYKQGSTIVNLAGQRLNKMHKGINIVNGRKVAF
jgi:surface protein